MKHDADITDKLSARLPVLIIGRLMAVFVLLVASWVWNSGRLQLSYENLPRDLLLAFVIFVGLTIVYFFVARLSRNLEWQVRAQFIIDALLITWLVWKTGDISSPFISLYVVIISVASIFLSSKGTLIFSGICSAFFTLLSVTVLFEWLDSFSGRPELAKAIQVIAFHVGVFLVVGLLASRLADRHASGAKLLEAQKSLVSLKAVHERIIESIRSGLITTDLDGNIYTFNKAAEEITGFSAKEMKGKKVSTILGDIGDEIAAALTHETQDGQPERFECDVLTPEGFAVRVGYGISPLYAEDGTQSGLIITFQDLTQIRSMEESVRRKDRMAAVGRVAAGLAHEIRNPLGAMRGAIQIMESTAKPDSSQTSLMEIILRESDRLNQIITNFLTYARPRINNFSDVDVCEALSDTFTLLKHSPEIREHHELELKAPDHAVLISADSSQLKQIFWNLARNAIQAMPNGGKFSISLEILNNTRIRITFVDTGIGMSPEHVEQLFEPFSVSTTGGTGLGLSIVYQIVRDHGGTINVKSLEGQGTTINIELPRNAAQTDNLTRVQSGTDHERSKIEGLLTIQSNDQ